MQPDIVRPYTPGLVIVTFGEVIAVGAADGSFATVEMVEDGVVEQVGADGSVVINQSMNELGQLTLRLFGTSPANTLLQAIYNASRTSVVLGVRALTVFDGSTNTTHAAPAAWITRSPNREYADQLSPYEWVIRGSPMTTVGGTV